MHRSVFRAVWFAFVSCTLLLPQAHAQESAAPPASDEPIVEFTPKVESADLPVQKADESKDAEAVLVDPTEKSEPAQDGMTIEVREKKPKKKAGKKTVAKREVKTSSDKDADAETSLRWLQNGNTRFLKKTNRADGKAAADRKRLLNGEKPHAIVLSCSDSRVPPEIVFDQSLGEIYVVRVAGEALDSSVIASLEYAVDKLGPKLLVVMGHSQCSAVEAALALKDGDSVVSPDLERLLADIKPRLKTVQKEKPSDTLEVESAVNADGVARDLVRRSELIRKKVEAGQLTIKTALYRGDTGKVTFY